MTQDAHHKFETPIQLTYEQHFQAVFRNFISFLKTLESKIGKEEVTSILKEWSTQRGCEIAKGMEVTDFEHFKKLWKATTTNDYFSHVITVEFPEESDSQLACKYTECLYAKILKELEAEEFGYIMLCHPDFSMAEGMHPNLGLERTKTLMQGHDCCDHRYLWKD
ncbi:MAG: L-2-amino-thiazoline-4-carboxylic acid hydrolase [Candidatus Hodarchaeota archaeon]